MKPMKLLIESRPFCVFDADPMEALINTPSIEIVDMRGMGINDPAFVEALKSVDAVLSGNDLVVDTQIESNCQNGGWFGYDRYRCRQSSWGHRFQHAWGQ
jgi:hypothetical protein